LRIALAKLKIREDHAAFGADSTGKHPLLVFIIMENKKYILQKNSKVGRLMFLLYNKSINTIQ